MVATKVCTDCTFLVPLFESAECTVVDCVLGHANLHCRNDDQATCCTDCVVDKGMSTCLVPTCDIEKTSYSLVHICHVGKMQAPSPCSNDDSLCCGPYAQSALCTVCDTGCVSGSNRDPTEVTGSGYDPGYMFPGYVGECPSNDTHYECMGCHPPYNAQLACASDVPHGCNALSQMSDGASRYNGEHEQCAPESLDTSLPDQPDQMAEDRTVIGHSVTEYSCFTMSEGRAACTLDTSVHAGCDCQDVTVVGPSLFDVPDDGWGGVHNSRTSMYVLTDTAEYSHGKLCTETSEDSPEETSWVKWENHEKTHSKGGTEGDLEVESCEVPEKSHDCRSSDTNEGDELLHTPKYYTLCTEQQSLHHDCIHVRQGDKDQVAADHTVSTMDGHPRESMSKSPFGSEPLYCIHTNEWQPAHTCHIGQPKMPPTDVWDGHG